MRNYYFDIVLKFPAAYPKEPPTCEFSHPAIKHIDFFQDPASLPFLNASDKWTPSLTIPKLNLKFLSMVIIIRLHGLARVPLILLSHPNSLR